MLWNRLGATLANGGLPEEAIDAYRKALDLRPTFTRATYNLGVSCLNIGCYKEAAEHLLAAIEGQKMREDGKGKVVDAGDPNIDEDGSANLWQTLRRAFLCMVCFLLDSPPSLPYASLLHPLRSFGRSVSSFSFVGNGADSFDFVGTTRPCRAFACWQRCQRVQSRIRFLATQ